LPLEKRFGVRIIALLEVRVQNVSRDFGISVQEAQIRTIRIESDRRAFIRKYFYADIADSLNYNLIINTGLLSTEVAVYSVIGAIGKWN